MVNLPTLRIPSASLPAGNVSRQYTPSNWGTQKALYAITFKSQSTTTLTSPANIIGPDSTTDESQFTMRLDSPSVAAGHNSTTLMNMFVFDAIKRAQHRQTAIMTQHPLQTGFNISDHVIKQPISLVLEVGMSDAIASYSLTGYTPMWERDASKSVSAYQQMVAFMDDRQLMDINTRLQTYFNMVLVDIAVEDTARTYFGGLSMVLTFQQAIVADVSETFDSARIQTSGETTQGTVQPQPPSQTVVQQHKVNIPAIVNKIPAVTPPQTQIPGAGTYSSAIINNMTFRF